MSKLCPNATGTTDHPGVKAVGIACLKLDQKVDNWDGGPAPMYIEVPYVLKDVVDEIRPFSSELADSLSLLGAETQVVSRTDLPPLGRNPSCGPALCPIYEKEIYVSPQAADNFVAISRKLLEPISSQVPEPTQQQNLLEQSNGRLPLVALAAVITAAAIFLFRKATRKEKKELEMPMPPRVSV